MIYEVKARFKERANKIFRDNRSEERKGRKTNLLDLFPFSPGTPPSRPLAILSFVPRLIPTPAGPCGTVSF